MLKNSVKVLALLSVAAPALAADNFNYLSGGYLYQSLKNQSVIKIDKDGKKTEKNKFHGIYLDLNKEIYDRVFLSGRLQDTGSFRSHTFGVGYHYPISSQVSLYGMVGLDKIAFDKSYRDAVEVKTKTTSTVTAAGIINNTSTESETCGIVATSLRSKLAPTIEVGIKAALSDQFGLGTSYRYASHKADVKFKQHEVRLLGYYNVSDKLAIEAGYNFTKLKPKNSELKATTINGGTLGVRYYL